MKKVLPDGENVIITKHDIDRKNPRSFIQIELMAYDELYSYLNIRFKGICMIMAVKKTRTLQKCRVV